MISHLGVRGQTCTNTWKGALKLEKEGDMVFCWHSTVFKRGPFKMFADLTFLKIKY